MAERQDELAALRFAQGEHGISEPMKPIAAQGPVTLKCALCNQYWKWDGRPLTLAVLDDSGRVVHRLGAVTPQPTRRDVCTCMKCRFSREQRASRSGTDTDTALVHRQRVKKAHTDS